ncbi:unnamed protein product [Rotaria sp. Silwood1]|nr:unnamed protein product [Rotaria sp. Silwood1]
MGVGMGVGVWKTYLKGFVHGRSVDEEGEQQDIDDDLFDKKERIDENAESTDEEIHPEKEKDLLWLTREGLRKPLSLGWKACQEENGELYYFYFNTRKSSWDHPYDDIYKTHVIQAREKKTLSSIVFDTLSKGPDRKENESTAGITPYFPMSFTINTLVAKWIAEYGLPDALDLNYDITRKYTPTWYDEELRGLAAELIKAACSVLGTWDESTISSTLLHLRSLNWDERAPIDKYSTITIYHLNASYEDYANHFHDYYKQKYTTSHTFANFDYADLVGAIRAYIQFSNSLNIALAMLINTKRTCSVHLNLEEFHRNTSNNNIGFLGIEYRAKEFNVYL